MRGGLIWRNFMKTTPQPRSYDMVTGVVDGYTDRFTFIKRHNAIEGSIYRDNFNVGIN